MLGILKADCIHVPLDTSSPAVRLLKIVESCEPRFILAAGAVSPLLNELMAELRPESGVSLGWLGEDMAPSEVKSQFSGYDVSLYPATPLTCETAQDDPAHILFTSGSTGMPKGVVITHSNVMHFVRWANRYFGTNSSDRISGHPPLHFDLSTFDIFGTFAAGAELHLVPLELSLLPNKLADFIRSSKLTQWFSVPSILNSMAKFDVVGFDDFPYLKRVLWCGEVFPTPALIYWMKRLPGVEFTNLYGPTEATIASSYYTVPSCPEDERAPIPIGTACDGEELLVLNDRLEPVECGETGDLYIGGVGLSPGYWKDREKTDSAFISYSRSPDRSERIYRTGDLARTGDDGLIYFLGRADTQIKSRGYRIELGEVETALSAIESLKECAVVAIDSDGFEGSVICCAYVPQPDSDATPITLRKQLTRVLPAYMAPHLWILFDRLPQNANGKIDRPALRKRFQSEAQPFGLSVAARRQ